PAVDAVVALYTPPVMGGAELVSGARPGRESVAAAIVGAAGKGDKPVVATYLGLKGMTPDLRVLTPEGEAGPGSVPSYPAPEDAVRALAYATRYASWRRRPQGRVPEPAGIDRERARGLVARWLTDGGADAAELLACYGVEVTGSGGAGVGLHIVTQEDPSFGAVITFRLADVAAALLDDRAYRLAPLTEVEAAEMVRAVRMAPLLFGHLGADPVDIGSVEELLLRVSQLGADLPEVARLELDPVLAGGSGVVVGSAKLRLERPVGPRPELAPRRL
ncbi:MAG: acetate--CoA ligase family protein, partial [Streptosporangiaceae bacterium]